MAYKNPALAEPPNASVLQRIKDLGLDIFADMPIAALEGVVGLADIPTMGYAGKGLSKIGYDPKSWHEQIGSIKSEERQYEEAKQSEAYDESFLGGLAYSASNPASAVGSIIQSLPLMYGGRGLVKYAAKIPALSNYMQNASLGSKITQGLIGEGTVMAGMSMEQMRQESEDGTITPAQWAIALGIGGVGGTIGGVSAPLVSKLTGGRISPRDIDLPIGTPAREIVEIQASKSLTRQMFEGALTEGVFEELPQSMQESVLQNLATGKDWNEGLSEAAGMGLITGGMMGGAFQGAGSMKAKMYRAMFQKDEIRKSKETATDNAVVKLREDQNKTNIAHDEGVSEGKTEEDLLGDAPSQDELSRDKVLSESEETARQEVETVSEGVSAAEEQIDSSVASSVEEAIAKRIVNSFSAQKESINGGDIFDQSIRFAIRVGLTEKQFIDLLTSTYGRDGAIVAKEIFPLMEEMVDDLVSESTDVDKFHTEIDKPANVYSSDKEFKGLSNFAPSQITQGGTVFSSVEQAFQAAKALFAGDKKVADQIMKEKSGARIKSLGKKVKFSADKLKEWNQLGPSIIEQLMRASFEQNPAKLALLMKTGRRTITHEGPKGVNLGHWKNTFPAILTKIREDYHKDGHTPFDQEVDNSNVKSTDNKVINNVKGLSGKSGKPVYSEEGINTLRKYGTHKHFGNPFVVGKKYKVVESADNYAQWLSGENHQEVNPEQREWILSQIDSGKTDGKDLLYYTDLGRDSHADKLAQFIAQRNSTRTVSSGEGNRGFLDADIDRKGRLSHSRKTVEETTEKKKRTRKRNLKALPVAQKAEEVLKKWKVVDLSSDSLMKQILDLVEPLKFPTRVVTKKWVDWSKLSKEERGKIDKPAKYRRIDAKDKSGTIDTPITKIISGGQSGADIAGLDVAQSLGIPTGGTAAAKFSAFDDKGKRVNNTGHKKKYGLKEGKWHKNENTGKYDPYRQRTIANANEADGTIWFGNDNSPGARVTFGKEAQTSMDDRLSVPVLNNPKNAEEIRKWIKRHNIKVINVAGNREHTNRGIYQETVNMMTEALTGQRPTKAWLAWKKKRSDLMFLYNIASERQATNKIGEQDFRNFYHDADFVTPKTLSEDEASDRRTIFSEEVFNDAQEGKEQPTAKSSYLMPIGIRYPEEASEDQGRTAIKRPSILSPVEKVDVGTAHRHFEESRRFRSIRSIKDTVERRMNELFSSEIMQQFLAIDYMEAEEGTKENYDIGLDDTVIGEDVNMIRPAGADLESAVDAFEKHRKSKWKRGKNKDDDPKAERAMEMVEQEKARVQEEKEAENFETLERIRKELSLNDALSEAYPRMIWSSKGKALREDPASDPVSQAELIYEALDTLSLSFDLLAVEKMIKEELSIQSLSELEGVPEVLIDFVEFSLSIEEAAESISEEAKTLEAEAEETKSLVESQAAKIIKDFFDSVVNRSIELADPISLFDPAKEKTTSVSKKIYWKAFHAGEDPRQAIADHEYRANNRAIKVLFQSPKKLIDIVNKQIEGDASFTGLDLAKIVRAYGTEFSSVSSSGAISPPEMTMAFARQLVVLVKNNEIEGLIKEKETAVLQKGKRKVAVDLVAAVEKGSGDAVGKIRKAVKLQYKPAPPREKTAGEKRKELSNAIISDAFRIFTEFAGKRDFTPRGKTGVSKMLKRNAALSNVDTAYAFFQAIYLGYAQEGDSAGYSGKANVYDPQRIIGHMSNSGLAPSEFTSLDPKQQRKVVDELWSKARLADGTYESLSTKEEHIGNWLSENIDMLHMKGSPHFQEVDTSLRLTDKRAELKNMLSLINTRGTNYYDVEYVTRITYTNEKGEKETIQAPTTKEFDRAVELDFHGANATRRTVRYLTGNEVKKMAEVSVVTKGEHFSAGDAKLHTVKIEDGDPIPMDAIEIVRRRRMGINVEILDGFKSIRVKIRAKDGRLRFPKKRLSVKEFIALVKKTGKVKYNGKMVDAVELANKEEQLGTTRVFNYDMTTVTEPLMRLAENFEPFITNKKQLRNAQMANMLISAINWQINKAKYNKDLSEEEITALVEELSEEKAEATKKVVAFTNRIKAILFQNILHSSTVVGSDYFEKIVEDYPIVKNSKSNYTEADMFALFLETGMKPEIFRGRLEKMLLEQNMDTVARSEYLANYEDPLDNPLSKNLLSPKHKSMYQGVVDGKLKLSSLNLRDRRVIEVAIENDHVLLASKEKGEKELRKVIDQEKVLAKGYVRSIDDKIEKTENKIKLLKTTLASEEARQAYDELDPPFTKPARVSERKAPVKAQKSKATFDEYINGRLSVEMSSLKRLKKEHADQQTSITKARIIFEAALAKTADRQFLSDVPVDVARIFTDKSGNLSEKRNQTDFERELQNKNKNLTVGRLFDRKAGVLYGLITKAFGADLVVVHDLHYRSRYISKASDGRAKIVINVNSPTNFSRIYGHELFHHVVAKADPAAYKAFRNAVVETISPRDFERITTEMMRERGFEPSDDPTAEGVIAYMKERKISEEEVFAEMMAHLVADKGFYDALAKTFAGRKLAAKIIIWLTKKVEAVNGALIEYDSEMTYTGMLLIDQSQMRDLHRLFADFVGEVAFDVANPNVSVERFMADRVKSIDEIVKDSPYTKTNAIKRGLELNIARKENKAITAEKIEDSLLVAGINPEELLAAIAREDKSKVSKLEVEKPKKKSDVESLSAEDLEFALNDIQGRLNRSEFSETESDLLRSKVEEIKTELNKREPSKAESKKPPIAVKTWEKLAKKASKEISDDTVNKDTLDSLVSILERVPKHLQSYASKLVNKYSETYYTKKGDIEKASYRYGQDGLKIIDSPYEVAEKVIMGLSLKSLPELFKLKKVKLKRIEDYRRMQAEDAKTPQPLFGPPKKNWGATIDGIESELFAIDREIDSRKRKVKEGVEKSKKKVVPPKRITKAEQKEQAKKEEQKTAEENVEEAVEEITGKVNTASGPTTLRQQMDRLANKKAWFRGTWEKIFPEGTKDRKQVMSQLEVHMNNMKLWIKENKPKVMWADWYADHMAIKYGNMIAFGANKHVATVRYQIREHRKAFRKMTTEEKIFLHDLLVKGLVTEYVYFDDNRKKVRTFNKEEVPRGKTFKVIVNNVGYADIMTKDGQDKYLKFGITKEQIEAFIVFKEIADKTFAALKKLHPELDYNEFHYGQSIKWYRKDGTPLDERFDYEKHPEFSRFEGRKQYLKQQNKDMSTHQIEEEYKLVYNHMDPDRLLLDYVYDVHKQIEFQRAIGQAQKTGEVKEYYQQARAAKDGYFPLADNGTKTFQNQAMPDGIKILIGSPENGVFYKNEETGQDVIFETGEEADRVRMSLKATKGGKYSTVRVNYDRGTVVTGFIIKRKYKDEDPTFMPKIYSFDGTEYDKAVASLHELRMGESNKNVSYLIETQETAVKGSMVKRLYFKKDLAFMLNNYLADDKLRNNSLFGLTGRKIMDWKNQYTSIEFAISLFHAMTIAQELIASNAAWSYGRMRHDGKIGFKSLLKDYNPIFAYRQTREIAALMEAILADTSLAKDPAIIKKAQELFRTKNVNVLDAIIQFYDTGGLTGMDKSLRSKVHYQGDMRYKDGDAKVEIVDGKAVITLPKGSKLPVWVPGPFTHAPVSIKAISESMSEVWTAMKKEHPDHKLTAAFETGRFGVMEGTTAWLMEQGIPRVKMAMWAREYTLEIDRNSRRAEDQQVTKEFIARNTMKFIEDRFGEVNWQNTWMNPSFKTGLQFAFRSFTWFTGSWTALAKAGVDVGKLGWFTVKGEEYELTNRGLWAMNAIVAHMMAVGLIYSMFTMASIASGGAADDDDDVPLLSQLLFPRVDPSDPSKRVAVPSYVTEWYKMFRHIGLIGTHFEPSKLISGRFNSLLGKGVDLAKNSDFRGVTIRNESDGVIAQTVDALLHMAPLPISLSVATKNMKTQGFDIGSLMISGLGMVDAPATAKRSKAANKAFEIRRLEYKGREITSDEMELKNEAKRAAYAYGQGDQDPLMQMLIDGKISRVQYINAIKRLPRIGGEKNPMYINPLAAALKGLTIDGALVVWGYMSDAEKETHRPTILKKYRNMHQRGYRPLEYKLKILEKLKKLKII